MWKHVYAVPCNGIQECSDSSDESNCKFPPWVLPCTLAGTIIVLFSTLLFYLWNFLNDVIRDLTARIPQNSTDNGHYGHLKLFNIATSVEKEDFKEIKLIYDKEIVIHGNEAIAICCLKVGTFNTKHYILLPNSIAKTVLIKFISSKAAY